MTESEILKELIDLIKELLPDVDTSNITPETLLYNDMGLNSLNVILIAVGIEDHFNITVEEDFKAQTVGDVCRYISGKKI